MPEVVWALAAAIPAVTAIGYTCGRRAERRKTRRQLSHIEDRLEMLAAHIEVEAGVVDLDDELRALTEREEP